MPFRPSLRFFRDFATCHGHLFFSSELAAGRYEVLWPLDRERVCSCICWRVG